MDRAQLLGPETGYQPGGGYRPEGLTWRGIALAWLVVGALVAAEWLLAGRFGERAMQKVTWTVFGLCYGWNGARMIRFPERYDRFGDGDHRRTRRSGAFLVLLAAAALLFWLAWV